MRNFLRSVSVVFIILGLGSASPPENVPGEFQEYFALVNRVRRHAIQGLHDYTRGACDLSLGAQLLTDWFHYRNNPLDSIQIEEELVQYSRSCHVRMMDELFHNFGADMLANFNNNTLAHLSIRRQNRIEKLVHEQNKVSLQIPVEMRRLECFESIRSKFSSSSVISGSTFTFLASSRPASEASAISQIVGDLKTQTEVERIDFACRAAVEFIETFRRTSPYAVACLRNALDPKPVEETIRNLKSVYNRLELDLSRLL